MHKYDYITYAEITTLYMRNQKVLSGGGGGRSNSDNAFLVDEGREDQYATKSGPLSAHQRNAF